MREFMHQKFFMFYDFLQDGFIDFAMEFYEDPFDFDIDEAKARKEKEEAGSADDIEKQDCFEEQNEEKDELLKPEKKKK